MRPVRRRGIGSAGWAPSETSAADAEGNWSMSRPRPALRMANHTRVFHNAPSKEVVLAPKRWSRQFQSGEGAIQSPLRRSAPQCRPAATAELPQRSSSTIYVGPRDRREAGRWSTSIPRDQRRRAGAPAGTLWGSIPAAKSWELIPLPTVAEIHLNRIDPSRPSGPGRLPFKGRLAWRWPCLLNHDSRWSVTARARALDRFVA